MKVWTTLVIGAALGAAVTMHFQKELGEWTGKCGKASQDAPAARTAASEAPAAPVAEPLRGSWRSLPERAPAGVQEENIKCFMEDPAKSGWQAPEFVYNHDVAVKPRAAKVVVLIYNPVLESQGGKTLIEYLHANDPRAFSEDLCRVVREASGGYINYEIVDVIEHASYNEKIDGFTYTEETFLAARKDNSWHQPDRSDYRKIFEENDLVRRCKEEGITEVWIWGAGGFGYDELAMYFPNRYARFAPTENPWFYRPYEIPEEIGHTVWVMGFNYECGADNMIHSYGHRVESVMALVFGRGVWAEDLYGQDPWNTFTAIPEGGRRKLTAQIGNVHVPPNGVQGYDYGNTNLVSCGVNAWYGYPDLSRGRNRIIGREEWECDQYGYQQWWLRQLPRLPGYTRWGYNNWWVYVANTDEELPEYVPSAPQEFVPPNK